MRLGNQNQIILHLMRHGQTEANEKHLYCGQTDLPLSPDGRAQLLALPRPQLRTDRYFHSGLRRTAETLNLLFDTPPSAAIPDLREIHLGAFELFSYEQLKENPDYLHWIKNIETARPPGGETQRAFCTRVCRGLDCAAQPLSGGQSALIVTHGGVIATLMQTLLPGEKNHYQWQPACAEGYSLYFDRGRLLRYTPLEKL